MQLKITALLVVTLIAASRPDAATTQSIEAEPSSVEVVARVDEFAITLGSVKQLLRITVPRYPDAYNQRPLRNVAIEQLVNRFVVYQFLEQASAGAGNAEIRLAVEELKSDLALREKTLEDLARESERTEEEIVFELAWKIAWNRYLGTKLTDQHLQEFFAENRRQFDGTTLHVAHLFLRPTETQPREQCQSLAEEVKRKLVKNELDWDQAVREYSQAPTRLQGGDIGWISFSGPMPRPFSLAAFELKPGEVSSPIETEYGIHLIKCLEEQPGKIGWRDAETPLRVAAGKVLFQRIASLNRDRHKIQRLPID